MLFIRSQLTFLLKQKSFTCNKTPLSRNEIGLVKKLIDKKSDKFYCLGCLAEMLEVTEDELIEKIEEFKDEGCTLFK